MGGRGASSSIKKYTEKDIQPIKMYFSKTPIGYEVNNLYLLKNYYGFTESERYNWVIYNQKYIPQNINIYNKEVDKGNIIQVNSFKEGKEKLIQMANKKKGGKK